MECCFCGRAIATSVGDGRTFQPDYCRDCGDMYTRELGSGWERAEWAQAVFRSHRRLMYVEGQEAGWVRLDSGQSGWANGRDILEAGAGPIVGRPGAGDLVLDDVLAELMDRGWGGDRIHRELVARGWDISQRTVYYRLARLRAPVVDGDAQDPLEGGRKAA